MDPAEATPARFAALGSRNFRLLWVGLLTSNVGTWMASTAQGWLVTELVPDRAPFALGLVAVAFAVPMLVLPPVGGALADRVPRLRVLWAAQLIYLALSAALTVLTVLDLARVPILIGYALLTGAVLAFDNPTRQALVPDLVTREQLTSAISLNSAVFSGAALVGPAIAGALIPLVGVGGVFAANTCSYFAVLVALSRLRGVPERPSEGQGGSIWATASAGLRYVVRTPLVAVLLSLSLVAGLLGRSYGPLLAVFARDVFRVDSLAFGLLVAAPGLGTLAGSLGLAARGNVRRKGPTILLATLAFSGVLGLFAATTRYWLALPALALAGLTSTLGAALIATLIQLRVPPELRGRVMSLYTMTVIGVPALGTLLVGWVGDQVGVRAAVGGAAALAGVLTAAAFAASRDLREAT